MIETLYQFSQLLVNSCFIFIFIFSSFKIYTFLNKSRRIKNKMANIEELMSEIDVDAVENDDVDEKRSRLTTLAVGGYCKTYLGKDLSTDQVEKFTDDEIRSAYAKYESRLGAMMTKTLGKSMLTLYSYTVGLVLPISEENKPKMVEEMELDPFVAHAISGFTCKLYHNYGAYLAPLTAALTTAKYCDFNLNKKKHNVNNNSNGVSNESNGETDQGEKPEQSSGW